MTRAALSLTLADKRGNKKMPGEDQESIQRKINLKRKIVQYFEGWIENGLIFGMDGDMYIFHPADFHEWEITAYVSCSRTIAETKMQSATFELADHLASLTGCNLHTVSFRDGYYDDRGTINIVLDRK